MPHPSKIDEGGARMQLQKSLVRVLDPNFNAVRAGTAGAAAAMVYLGVMAGDMRLTGSNSDDLLMLGGVFTADERRARLLGVIPHTSFACMLGLLYGAVFRRRLRGPNWARGVTMTLAENLLLWPLTPLVDRFHPWMRSGALPKLNSPVPFLQQLDRHLVFGAVLGYLYGRGENR
jgi:hypothetical protein